MDVSPGAARGSKRAPGSPASIVDLGTWLPKAGLAREIDKSIKSVNKLFSNEARDLTRHGPKAWRICLLSQCLFFTKSLCLYVRLPPSLHLYWIRASPYLDIQFALLGRHRDYHDDGPQTYNYNFGDSKHIIHINKNIYIYIYIYIYISRLSSKTCFLKF